jgi:hypothetical protein
MSPFSIILSTKASKLNSQECDKAAPISTSIRSNNDILLANFPEIVYFLEQENK